MNLGDRPFSVGLRAEGAWHDLREGEENLTVLTALAKTGFDFVLWPRISLGLEAFGGARVGIVGQIPGGSWVAAAGWSVGYLLRNGMEVALWQTWNYWHDMFISIDGGIGMAVPVGPNRRSLRAEEPALRSRRRLPSNRSRSKCRIPRSPRPKLPR